MNTFIIRFLDEAPVIVVAASVELAVMKAFDIKEDEIWNIMQGISYCALTPEQEKLLKF